LVVLFLMAGCGQGGGDAEARQAGSTPSSDQASRAPEGNTTATTSTTTASSTTTATSTPTTTPPTTTPPTTTTRPAPPAVRDLDLRAATYRLLCPDGEVDVDLRAPSSPGPSGPVTVDQFEPIFGEVTGDGREDAIIHITCIFADGGNAAAAAVIVVSSEPDGLTQVGQPIDGYAPVVVGSRFVVARAVYGPDDARCCPGATAHVPMTLDAGRWIDGGGGDAVGTDELITTSGLGALRIGAPYAEIAAETGQSILVEDPLQSDGACVYVSIDSLPEVHGLGGDGALHSIEVDDPAVRTRSGLGIGSSAAEVEGAFPGRIGVEPHPYDEAGQYLVFTPADEPGRLVVFETDGAVVNRYRVGEPSWALAIEGCA